MNLSRRELLAIFLGAPFAAVACKKKPSLLPPGEIVGASFHRGHRLRAPSAITPHTWRTRDVVIIGGGPAGLSAAWRLRREKDPIDYEILELEPQAGGTSRYGVSGTLEHPWGAHYVNTPMRENKAMITLLDELSVIEGRTQDGEPIVAEQFLCREPDERTFYRGRWYEGLYLHAGATQDDLSQLAKFEQLVGEWADFRDAKRRRAFAIPMAHGSDDDRVTALDRITMSAWLTDHGLTSPRLLWLVDYACRDDYGTKPNETSAWAGLFYFAARKRSAKAESQPVITWPAGNGRLVQHLAKGAAITGGALVTEVRPVEGGVEVIGLDTNDTPFGIRCRRAVLAAPQFIAARLVPERKAAPFEYGTWLVSNVHVSERPASRGFPLAWDNVIYDSPSLGYVVATHQRGLDRGPSIFTHYFPMCDAQARKTLLSLDRDACADLVLADLRRAHSEIASLTTRLDVMRWGHAMIRPKPGAIFDGTRTKASEPYRGICFAHSDLSGVALFEEAFYRGALAAETTLKALGRSSESIL